MTSSGPGHHCRANVLGYLHGAVDGMFSDQVLVGVGTWVV